MGSSIYQTRSSGKTSGGLAMFVHNSITYSVKKNLSTNREDIKALCIEIINAKIKTYYLTRVTDRRMDGAMNLKFT